MNPVKKMLIAADHAGFPLKEALKRDAAKIGVEFEDLGTYNAESVDYPDFADKVCAQLSGADDDLAVLVCGSGIGISIAANRHSHIRAALCESVTTARKSREHNHANILCLGAQIVSEPLAVEMIKAFLTATLDQGERHLRRINKLAARGTPKTRSS
jgi:ribose 5-phosphate isomerase B